MYSSLHSGASHGSAGSRPPALQPRRSVLHQTSPFLLSSTSAPPTLGERSYSLTRSPSGYTTLIPESNRCKMLGPFRVRNLRPKPSHLTTPLPAGPAGSRRPSLDGIISIRAQEYDDTVSSHPEAELRYFDDDDGELITVSCGRSSRSRLRSSPIARSALILSFPNDSASESPNRYWQVSIH